MSEQLKAREALDTKDKATIMETAREIAATRKAMKDAGAPVDGNLTQQIGKYGEGKPGKKTRSKPLDPAVYGSVFSQ